MKHLILQFLYNDQLICIEKKIKTISLTKNNYSGTYDGDEHTGSVNVTTSDVTIKYGTTSGTYNLDNIPKYTNAGLYTIYFKVSKDGYNTIEDSITVNINKAGNNLSISETSGNLVYPNNKDVTINNPSGGNLFIDSSDNTIASSSIVGNKLSIISKDKEGNAVISLTSVETANYKSKTVTYSANITFPTYNVSIVKNNATVNSNNITIKYKGNNTVTITPDSNYYLSSVSCTNGYTTNAVVGTSSTNSQTVTISNNSNLSDSTCTFTTTVVPLTLYNTMKNNASNDTINFSVRSGVSGTNGIYKTTATESSKTVYYYRGNVNNHVIFNNMCWRIVRTTETGGVKLIYNGVPIAGKCQATGTNTQIGTSAFNTYGDDNAYVGYMYGTAGSSNYEDTHANINDSTVKGIIDTWYKNNFKDNNITSKIEDTVYCNDRTIISDTTNIDTSWTTSSTFENLGYAKKGTLYGANSRSYYFTLNPNPSHICSRALDKFTVSSSNGNGKLSYPVGLLTLDEIIFAGFNTCSSNSNCKNDTNYLSTGQFYWTMTPVYYVSNNSFTDVGRVTNTGYASSSHVDYASGVRPVISLKEGTAIKNTGNGSSTSPYIVE